MRGSLRPAALIAALMGSTALTPEPAHAGPVIGFLAGAVGLPGTAAAAVGINAGFAAGATFAGTVGGGFLVRTVVSIGLSALAASLAPKPSIPPPAAQMVNFAQPISYAQWVYGRTRKGGPLGFTGFTDGRRYYVPILAAHEIEGIYQHWLDETPITLTVETDQDKSNVATEPMAGFGRIDPFLGGAGQTADAGLVSAFTEITSAHDFKGLAGAVVWAKRPPQSRFSEIYPGGRQWAWAPVIDGNNRIYDPRDGGSTGYTNNAALVLAHWLSEVLGREVDWDDVAGEADVCDETVTTAEAEDRPRWTINGTISDDQEFEDQRAQLAAACDAFIFERADGKVGFRVGRWIAPTVTLTVDDFLAFEITEGGWGADAPSEVAVVYTEPENAWRETPAGVWVEDATARRVRDEPQIFMITSHNQAARVAKRIAKTRRARYQLRGTLGMIGYELFGQRFIRVQHAEMEIDEYFEIGELAREGGAAFSLTANSVNPADFDFTAATEEPARPAYGSVTNDGSVPVPTGLDGGAVDGGAILWVWDAQDAAYTQEVRYRETGETDWLSAQTSESAERLLIGGLTDGLTYEAQMRNRTAGSGVSDWAPATPVEVAAVVDSTAPAPVSDFAAVRDGDDVDLTFVAPNDAHYFGTRIYRATNSSDFGDASLIHTEYGIPSDGDAWTDTAPGYATFYYWAAGVNASAVEGTKSGPESVMIPVPGP